MRIENINWYEISKYSDNQIISMPPSVIKYGEYSINFDPNIVLIIDKISNSIQSLRISDIKHMFPYINNIPIVINTYQKKNKTYGIVIKQENNDTLLYTICTFDNSRRISVIYQKVQGIPIPLGYSDTKPSNQLEYTFETAKTHRSINEKPTEIDIAYLYNTSSRFSKLKYETLGDIYLEFMKLINKIVDMGYIKKIIVLHSTLAYMNLNKKEINND